MKLGLCHVALLLCAGVASAEDLKTVVVSHQGAAVMTLRVAAGSKVTTKNEETVVDNKQMRLNLWVVPKTQTVAAAIDNLDEVIKSEVLKFRPATTEAITVAGADGKQMMGKGLEADDQDPATVDVVVFLVGKTVLVACVHGEGDTAIQQRGPMLQALKTVAAP